MRRGTVVRRATSLMLAVASTALSPVMSVLPAQATQAGQETQILLVHGYGSSSQGKDCNGDTWKNALAYYQAAAGRERSSMSTVGYYEGDRPAEHHGASSGCDVVVGDGEATNDRPIQDLARDLAAYIDDTYTGSGQPVNIVAHSMGGLITRVAMLGSAQGWDGFPSTLDVDNVVTLSTPHQGVADPSAHGDRQWEQMTPNSGFMTRLHQDGSGLGDDWADGTDWSLVGSFEDTTVRHDSGIDKGGFADQKYGYQNDPGDSGEVGHSAVRTLYGENRYNLNYWHASGDHPTHHTPDNGWSPLKTAFQAATRHGDGLPK
jgi:pimeloyl-ACP methyl ester carboxylesterase